MRFLLDVNVGVAVSRFLKNCNHDVVAVADVDCRMEDDGILKWAFLENRVIITTDKDFEKMIWQHGKKHSGVLRIENLIKSERVELLNETIERFTENLENGDVVIATKTKFRVRKNFNFTL